MERLITDEMLNEGINYVSAVDLADRTLYFINHYKKHYEPRGISIEEYAKEYAKNLYGTCNSHQEIGFVNQLLGIDLFPES